MTIKELREKYNLTQSALARSLDVSSNAISGIEAGRTSAAMRSPGLKQAESNSAPR